MLENVLYELESSIDEIEQKLEVLRAEQSEEYGGIDKAYRMEIALLERAFKCLSKCMKKIKYYDNKI